MRLNSDSTRNFIYATVAVVILVLGASTLIGWDTYEQDRSGHRHAQEETK